MAFLSSSVDVYLIPVLSCAGRNLELFNEHLYRITYNIINDFQVSETPKINFALEERDPEKFNDIKKWLVETEIDINSLQKEPFDVYSKPTLSFFPTTGYHKKYKKNKYYIDGVQNESKNLWDHLEIELKKEEEAKRNKQNEKKKKT